MPNHCLSMLSLHQIFFNDEIIFTVLFSLYKIISRALLQFPKSSKCLVACVSFTLLFLAGKAKESKLVVTPRRTTRDTVSKTALFLRSPESSKKGVSLVTTILGIMFDNTDLSGCNLLTKQSMEMWTASALQ